MDGKRKSGPAPLKFPPEGSKRRRFKYDRKSKIYILFDRLIGEVSRLFTYQDWLPIQASQISFYTGMLKSLSKDYGRRAIAHKNHLSELVTDPTLNILITRILDHMKNQNVRTSVDFSKDNHLPPNLKSVGDRLAFEVALICHATKHDVEMADVLESFASKFCFVIIKSPIQRRRTGSSRRHGDRRVALLPNNYAEEMWTDDLSQHFHLNRNKIQDDEGFVGFHVEARNLLQRLASIPKKQLEVISIVGMAGLGKTTLARRLYNDPYVVSYFHVRAWVTCSHVYRRRDLLLDILRSVIEITDEVYKMNDLMLLQALYRALERHRYLIVIDDIWSNAPWDDFSICFPEVNNGSRIMLTTRFKHVALHVQFGGDPLSLRFLTEEESFDLFMSKIFKDGDFIGNLRLIAKNITRKCRGLPLAIVVIAGLLKNNLDKDWWAQVEESVSSYIVTDQNQYMDTLALSYNNLPQHLRPCFLSFGAFPEDHDIPVRKLISLWTAEGFIHQDDTNDSLEDVAKVYLMDLIGRSLVVVGKKGSNGEIKTCRIHDFLRDLCLRKAAEEKFSPDIYKYNKHYFSCPHSLTNPSTTSQLLLSPDVLTTPSNCSCYSSEVFTSFFKDIPVLWNSSKYIRTLDISSIELFLFPSEIVQLLHLRYLELRFRCGNPPESICHLRELQTLVMSSRMNMVVPESMWKLVNLKHLCINSGENLVNISTVEEPSLLENMQTMSLVSPTKCQNILNRTPNLQNLGLCGPLTTKSGDLICPDLSLLMMHLEKLKLLNTSPLCKAGSLSTSIIFPESLKSLTMSSTYLDWKESWIFEMMPNLETLKLKLHAFVGENWESCPDAFPRLKFLKLDELDIVTWTASCDDFPVLQRLQVYMCPYLMEIPEDFGSICTLEWIELSGCSDAATKSATDIKKEQESYGDDWLKILLKPGPTKRKHKVAAH